MNKRVFAIIAAVALLVSLALSFALLSYRPVRQLPRTVSATQQPTSTPIPTMSAAPTATIFLHSPTPTPAIVTPTPGSNAPATTTQPSAQRNPQQDTRPPTPVSDLRLHSNTATTFTVAWAPSFDINGVTHYEVTVNGYFATRTPFTSAQLDWFATEDPIVVAVSALDKAGNRSQWRKVVIIPPPLEPTPAQPSTEAPTPTPTGEPDPTPEPELTPSPSAAPTTTPAPADPTEAPTSATAEPTTSQTQPTPAPTVTATPSPESASSTSAQP